MLSFKTLNDQLHAGNRHGWCLSRNGLPAGGFPQVFPQRYTLVLVWGFDLMHVHTDTHSVREIDKIHMNSSFKI